MTTTKSILFVSEDTRPEHNYRKLLAQAVAKGLQLKPSAHHLDIYHDDWCAVWQGGCCNCEPEMYVRPVR